MCNGPKADIGTATFNSAMIVDLLVAIRSLDPYNQLEWFPLHY